MPYIEPIRRATLETGINALASSLRNLPCAKGDVNYAITEVVLRSMMPAGGWSYSSLSDVVSVLRDSADEIQRRMLGPYEDGAKERNGDCSSFKGADNDHPTPSNKGIERKTGQRRSCFSGPRGNESKHNKAAKRLASRRLRRLIKKEADTQFNAENQP